MARVKLKNVSKTYVGGIEAVKNFNLSVEDGEFVIFLGPTGSGKSTLIRLIAGLEKETSGHVYIGERIVNSLLPEDRNVSVIYQNSALYPDMTVKENLTFVSKLKRIDSDKIDKRLKEAIEFLDMDNIIDNKPSELSYVQKQKVLIGRSIVKNPDIVLIDEADADNDKYAKMNLLDEILKLYNKKGKTFIYATQNKEKALKVNNVKIVVIKDGCIQQVGTRDELYNRPNNLFVASLFNNPPIKFKEAKLTKKEDNIFIKTSEKVTEVSKESDKTSLTNYLNKDIVVGFRDKSVFIFEKDSGKCIYLYKK